MVETSALERLAASRAAHDEWFRQVTREPHHLPGRPTGIQWDSGPENHELVTFVSARISKGLEETCCLGYTTSTSYGTNAVVYRVVPTPELLEPYRRRKDRDSDAFEEFFDWGTGMRGHVAMSFRVFGADLNQLANIQHQIAWPTACLLHAAATTALRELHAIGFVHDALTARRIRLAIPLVGSITGGNTPPIRFLGQRFEPASAKGIRRDLHAVAKAIMPLTKHPDPEIEALIDDRFATSVLRDHLLEGERVESLLSDFAGLDLPAPELVDDPAIGTDLETLWRYAVLLDPLLTQVPWQEQPR